MDDPERDEGGGLGALFDDEEAIEQFFAPRERKRATPATPPAPERPAHYKVISISLYTEDIDRLDALVAELRARGHTRANKSMVIREALRQLDLEKVPGRR